MWVSPALTFHLTERGHAKTADALGKEFLITGLRDHIRRFLFHELHPGVPGASLSIDVCPAFGEERINIYYSALATYYAPTDPSSDGGSMHQEFVRATPKWRGGAARNDCVFVNKKNGAHGLLGLDIARVRLLFSFKYQGNLYTCAAVQWFWRINDQPDEDTGMWVVKPALYNTGRSRVRHPLISVIHLNTIVRATHLIGVSIGDPVPDGLESHGSLDRFKTFSVNKFVDHHAFELLHVCSR